MDNGVQSMNGYPGGGQYGGLESSNGGGEETNGVAASNGEQASEGPKYSDINLILDQILDMSGQNIDEAQVKKILVSCKRGFSME